MDDFSNIRPAHEACAVEKTRDDHRHAARAKRPKIRHRVAEVSKRLSFGKTGQRKRMLAGKIVPRA